MRVSVSGGTGYLGSRVIKKLEAGNNQIICMTRSPLLYTSSQRVSYVDLQTCLKTLGEFLPEMYINMVCCYGRGTGNEEILEANFGVPAKLLQRTAELGVGRVITIGTSLPNRFNMYAYSKKLFSDLGSWYAEQYGIQFFNVVMEQFYGKNMPEDRFVQTVVDRLRRNEPVHLTAGTQKRDFLHIEDAVDMLETLVYCESQEKYANIPVGSGEAPSVREVVEYLAMLTHSKSPLLFGSIPMRPNEPNTVADREIMEKWGIRAHWDWKRGMRDIIGNTVEGEL